MLKGLLGNTASNSSYLPPAELLGQESQPPAQVRDPVLSAANTGSKA